MSFGVGTGQKRLHSDAVMDKVEFVSDASLSMDVYDHLVHITLTAANNSTITLPSVAEARGGIYVIRLIAVGTGAVTVQDLDDDAALTSITLNAAGESTVLYSDGLKWNELQANYS